MTKKITALSMAILMLAFAFTVCMSDGKGIISDVSCGGVETFAAGETASTTSLSGFIGDKIGSVTNLGGVIDDVSDVGSGLGDLVGGSGLGSGLGSGIGDALGGLGDLIGGLVDGGGGSGNSGNSGDVTYDVNTETMGYIDIIPAVTDYASVPQLGTPSSTVAQPVNETVDFAATQNPYTKPTTDLKGGDTGEGVKWMQWIFIYTRYGLKDDGITGVFDEQTMAVVKKLQKENGMTVDGVVNDAVIDKIELLYFQTIYTTAAPAVATQPTAPLTTGADAVDGEKDAGSASIKTLFIIVIAVWVVAIAFVVALFIIKKSKGKKKAKANSDEKSAKETEDKPSEENN